MESTLFAKLPLFCRLQRNAHRYESVPDINFIDESSYSSDEQRIPGIVKSKSEYNRTASRSRLAQMKSRRRNHQSQVSVMRSETEKLRDENEKLKQRLNAANNTIRDLEYVCRKNGGKEEDYRRFCSFLPKAKTTKEENVRNVIDEHSIAMMSQASTVRMGSTTKKKSRRNQRKNSDEHILLHNQEKRWNTTKASSCPQSLISFGNKYHHRNLSPHNILDMTDTAPCTPERSPKTDQGSCSISGNDIASVRQKTDSMGFSVKETLEIRHNDNLQGVEVYHQPVLTQSEHFLTQAAIKTVPLSRMTTGLDRLRSSKGQNTAFASEEFAGQFPRIQSLNQGYYIEEDNSEDSSPSNSSDERVEI